MNEGFKLVVISSRRKEIKARVNYRKNLPKGGLSTIERKLTPLPDSSTY